MKFPSTDGFTFYPNPLEGGELHLDLNTIKGEFKALRIIDMQGVILYESYTPIKKIDLSELSFGMYLVQIETDLTLSSKRLIVH